MHKFLEHLKSGKWLKSPIFWARFFAYAIPLAFLLYVLYQNFLPLGYDKTFIINVGSMNDTNVGEFYLEPSKDLSERKVASNGTTYRELNGSAYAVFKPKAVLKNAEITVSVIGDGISIIPPVLNFDPSTITDWDYDWDFTKEIPKELIGNAFIFDGATYFDGTSRLELPNTANKFENRAFSVYVEWEPRDSENNTQQIIGHFNWELWQNKDNVYFQVGRMNDAQGPTYSIKYPIPTPANFFNKKHTALAIYNPANSTDSQNGYLELFIDGNFAGRTYFGSDTIWKDYNGTQNLSIGWTPHNNQNSPHFVGSIYKVYTVSKNVLQPQSEISLTATNNDLIYISIISTSDISTSTATSTIRKIKLNAVQK
ncbi:MAG: hypothetical protein WCK03_04225 [Candidatus Taylorbacteria bacterium]